MDSVAITGPSREEFNRLCQTIDQGFAGTHARLDTINGRVGRGEIKDGQLEIRIGTMEQEFVARTRRGDVDERSRRDDEARDVLSRPRFAKRDVSLAAVGVALMIGAIKLATLSGEFIFSFLKLLVKR